MLSWLISGSFHGTLSVGSQVVLVLVQEHHVRSETVPNVKGETRDQQLRWRKREDLKLIRYSVLSVAILFRVCVQG